MTDKNSENALAGLHPGRGSLVILGLMAACGLGLTAGPPTFLAIAFTLGLAAGFLLLGLYATAFIKVRRRQ
jgi:hypothetical protein